MAFKIYIEGDNFDKTSRGNGFLKQPPEVTTKLKPIPIEDANSEIEKGEIVLDPETGAMHKALGKPHSKGGTPVNLKNNSFIFSNFKDLAFNKKQKELFEFKSGGFKPKNNTPSKVLEKEVDLEHHNKMVDIMQNEKKNNIITVNSAKLMFLKNMEKAGQVAFLQESKKGENIPQFALNTAPVYSKDTDQQITQSMQYLQKGGLKSFQDGSKYTLTEEEKKLAKLKKLQDITGYTPWGKEGNITFYKKFKPKTGPQMSNEDWRKYIKTDDWKNKRAKVLANQTEYGYTEPQIKVTQAEPITYTPKAPSQIIPRVQPKGNPAGEIDGIIDRTNYKTSLTPWQYLNMAIPFYRGMKVKTQYPLRQHQESIIPQFDNKNVQPLLNENNQGYFNAANTLRTLNPSQASPYAQLLYGNRLNANNKAISEVQDFNISTQNKQKEMAAATLNNDAAQNRIFDLKYYDQTQTALKNTDELKQAYEQQGIQGINETMSKKLAFDSWINSQKQYRGKKTYIDKDGIQHYQGVAPFTPKANFFGYSIQNNPTNIDWRTYQSDLSNKVDSPEEIKAAYQTLKEIDPDFKLADFLKNKNFMQYLQTNPNALRKGGKFQFKQRFKN